MVKIKNYLPPQCNCNIDYEFDTAIRSDLLIDVLNDFYKNNFEIKADKQNNNIGETYFVIHPLLKHMAIIPLA